MHAADPSLLDADFLPQAQIKYPVDELTRRLGLIEACDDLDDFTGGAFVLDHRVSFTIKHYRDNADLFTIYLPRDVSGQDDIKDVVTRIMRGLDLPRGTLVWDRASRPDLG